MGGLFDGGGSSGLLDSINSGGGATGVEGQSLDTSGGMQGGLGGILGGLSGGSSNAGGGILNALGGLFGGGGGSGSGGGSGGNQQLLGIVLSKLLNQQRTGFGGSFVGGPSIATGRAQAPAFGPPDIKGAGSPLERLALAMASLR